MKAHATDKPKKERTTFQLPVDLIERARNTVYWTPGLTLSALLTEGLTLAIQKREKRDNRGKPFPKRTGPVKTGRPVKM